MSGGQRTVSNVRSLLPPLLRQELLFAAVCDSVSTSPLTGGSLPLQTSANASAFVCIPGIQAQVLKFVRQMLSSLSRLPGPARIIFICSAGDQAGALCVLGKPTALDKKLTTGFLQH